MTTPEAEKRYLAEHILRWGDRACAIFNPHGRPIAELPVIYGFNNGGSSGLLLGILMAEDGTCLGSHACSHEGYMPSDLGVLEGSAPKRHETFRKHYPDGYRMEFVRMVEVRDHIGLMEAYQRNQAAKAKATSNE